MELQLPAELFAELEPVLRHPDLNVGGNDPEQFRHAAFRLSRALAQGLWDMSYRLDSRDGKWKHIFGKPPEGIGVVADGMEAEVLTAGLALLNRLHPSWEKVQEIYAEALVIRRVTDLQ